jgi:protein gp37
MGIDTGISWTHHTFNPWAGCTKVSPACDHCYAESDTARYGYVKWGKDAVRRRTVESYWKQLKKWNASAEKEGIRRRVFIGSWCDIMEDHPELQAIREDLYPLIMQCDWLDHLLLTKRPQNFRRFLPRAWMDRPLPNVWGMTTVESPEYLWRAEALVSTPFAVRGLSMEPLLGEFPQMDWAGIDWAIVGGESQAGARPMRIEWARGLRDQCSAAAVAFHFKQWGEHDSGLVKIGKKAAGSLLDGVEWKQFPERAL